MKKKKPSPSLSDQINSFKPTSSSTPPSILFPNSALYRSSSFQSLPSPLKNSTENKSLPSSSSSSSGGGGGGGVGGGSSSSSSMSSPVFVKCRKPTPTTKLPVDHPSQMTTTTLAMATTTTTTTTTAPLATTSTTTTSSSFEINSTAIYSKKKKKKKQQDATLSNPSQVRHTSLSKQNDLSSSLFLIELLSKSQSRTFTEQKKITQMKKKWGEWVSVYIHQKPGIYFQLRPKHSTTPTKIHKVKNLGSENPSGESLKPNTHPPSCVESNDSSSLKNLDDYSMHTDVLAHYGLEKNPSIHLSELKPIQKIQTKSSGGHVYLEAEITTLVRNEKNEPYPINSINPSTLEPPMKDLNHASSLDTTKHGDSTEIPHQTDTPPNSTKELQPLEEMDILDWVDLYTHSSLDTVEIQQSMMIENTSTEPSVIHHDFLVSEQPSEPLDSTKRASPKNETHHSTIMENTSTKVLSTEEVSLSNSLPCTLLNPSEIKSENLETHLSPIIDSTLPELSKVHDICLSNEKQCKKLESTESEKNDLEDFKQDEDNPELQSYTLSELLDVVKKHFFISLNHSFPHEENTCPFPDSFDGEFTNSGTKPLCVLNEEAYNMSFSQISPSSTASSSIPLTPPQLDLLHANIQSPNPENTHEKCKEDLENSPINSKPCSPLPEALKLNSKDNSESLSPSHLDLFKEYINDVYPKNHSSPTMIPISEVSTSPKFGNASNTSSPTSSIFPDMEDDLSLLQYTGTTPSRPSSRETMVSVSPSQHDTSLPVLTPLDDDVSMIHFLELRSSPSGSSSKQNSTCSSSSGSSRKTTESGMSSHSSLIHENHSLPFISPTLSSSPVNPKATDYSLDLFLQSTRKVPTFSSEPESKVVSSSPPNSKNKSYFSEIKTNDNLFPPHLMGVKPPSKLSIPPFINPFESFSEAPSNFFSQKRPLAATNPPAADPSFLKNPFLSH